ncbi:hypothetical protein [uncultured Mucilaginibacter sp.]|uniref:hypothetical protein n=1 Tax=uncultured Mucilaginibacter sp. TaxID=797541 RepID=UPI0025D0987E|nr:hypothetical protein [uncultured Mucilaginibacter sp.]
MSFRLKYNGVVVIQSLLDDDKQTGKELFDDIIARRCEQTQKAPYFYQPSNKVEFLASLEEICALVIADDLFPIIHFEIHGNPVGLVLKNGEAVTWDELQYYCRMINVRVRNQLIITLATCYGSWIWKMIDITKPAPYWGYIGPREKIGEGTLMEDFQSFYDSLLTQDSWDNAIQELKNNGTRDKYIYLHCKGIFEYHIERNMKDIPLDKKATYKRLMKKTTEMLPGMNRNQRKAHLKNSISKFDRNSFISRMKRIFLME